MITRGNDRRMFVSADTVYAIGVHSSNVAICTLSMMYAANKCTIT